MDKHFIIMTEYNWEHRLFAEGAREVAKCMGHPAVVFEFESAHLVDTSSFDAVCRTAPPVCLPLMLAMAPEAYKKKIRKVLEGL